jgi:hypothetical protein
MKSPERLYLVLGSLLGPAVLLAPWSTRASGCPVQARLIEGKNIITLTGATVIDDTGAGPRQDAVIAIVKDRIVYVGDGSGAG